jgi:L,D-transpeptidase catalytic domain
MADNNFCLGNTHLTRRDFLKLSGVTLGTVPFLSMAPYLQQDGFPAADHLARVSVRGRVDLKVRPDIDSETVGVLYEDAVVPWLREVSGRNPFRYIQRFVETPDGYIWSPYLQHVQNTPNANPLVNVPSYEGEKGFWVEVTVPFVDLIPVNPPVRSPAFQNGVPMRLYYEQVIWADDIKVGEDGRVFYRINERYGTYGDIFWAPAEALRLIQPEEISPLSPDVENKKIVIDVRETVQTLSCYEGAREVYFCRVSAGDNYDADGNFLDGSSTPIGPHPTWRKLMSIHMSGGASGVGWDLIGVAWTTFFATPGIAIHGTFWHNFFGGENVSHGCVNVLPQDALWIFRWTQPSVDYAIGDLTVPMPGGTVVEIVES